MAALLGADDPDNAATRLGIDTAKLTVLAARSTGDGLTDRRRILDPLTLHLSIVHTRTVTTFSDATAYAVLPWPSTTDALTATKRIAEGFLRRVGHGHDIVIAIGGIRGPHARNYMLNPANPQGPLVDATAFEPSLTGARPAP